MSRALQKAIHVACRELGLNTDDRRALQLKVCGKASMSDMSEDELKAMVEQLKKDGFKTTSTARSKHKAAPRSDLRLIHVLWGKLGKAGVLERPDRAGLNTFIRSRFEATWGVVPADVDMLRERDQISDVIDALKAWGQRANIDFDWGSH
jgi:phage gp16-like protein